MSLVLLRQGLGRLSPSHNLFQQSITIPVNIRVTDDNDNAPIFVNSPYYVNVSEVGSGTFFLILLEI